MTAYTRLTGLLIKTPNCAKAENSRTFYNTDGLINWLRQPGLLLNKPPNIYSSKHYPTYYILFHLD